MEKRFALFLALSLGILVGYGVLMRTLSPQPPVIEQDFAADKDEPSADAGKEEAAEPAQPPSGQETPPTKPATAQPAAAEVAEAKATQPPQEGSAPEPQRVSFGSYANGQSLLITFNSRGAAIERAELTARDDKGKLRYRSLEHEGGYLGNLSLTPDPAGGCRINVVGDGTPAQIAGLRQDDVLLRVGDDAVVVPAVLSDVLAKTKPGDEITLVVRREDADVSLHATLDVWPLQLIKPELLPGGAGGNAPLSYLLSILEDGSEISAVPAENEVWDVVPSGDGAVEFHLPLRGDNLALVKRFRLGSVKDVATEPAPQSAYHVSMEIEIQNTSDQDRQMAYHLTGPNGLPTEGWWYSVKLHPKLFHGAGARDIICKTQNERRFIGCPELYKQARKQPDDSHEPLFAEDEPAEARTIQYLAVDTQYFAAVLSPTVDGIATPVMFQRGEAFAIGDVLQKKKGTTRTTNVSFDLRSEPFTLAPGSSHQQSFRLFLGPKVPTVLNAYGLDDVIYYGWFGGISKVLAAILHFFYRVVRNYGIAIILLTVLVRGCMFPISRKAAKNAAMMQELSPEMRKLTEKYKNDMEKRAKAQQDLFRKHNYNPLGGCWLMFLQLPIFLGLYRCIAVDINLRHAALIPGIQWCSNLAGPDTLLYWQGFMPTFLASETGMLGPYLNVFPLITVGLFLVHQKLFTPPPTDDQSKMQSQMMKYMTLFMGFLFFKVASGLCLYFIASSLWGITERKLIPKPKVKLANASAAVDTKSKQASKSSGSNGAAEKKAARKKRNKRR